MTTITPTVEMYLSGSWTSVGADVLDGISIRRGITGTSPTDRVARAGTCNITLKNSAGNSGAKLGYYSPDNANLRTGFGIGTKMRVKFYDGTNTRYKFHGVITKISPVPGIYGQRRVMVQAMDYMNYLATRKLPQVAVQVNQRADQLITTLVALLDTAPLATSYNTAPGTYVSALDSERDEATTFLTVMQKICQSDLSYLYVSGDATGGETLCYQSRHARLSTTSAATITNVMHEMEVDRAMDAIYNVVRVTAHPRNAGTTTETVYTLQKEMTFSASQVITQEYAYTDPDVRNQRISATGVITLVAGTDYKFSSTSAASFAAASGDLNANLSVSGTYGANSASLTFTNTSGTTGGYLWFQIRAASVIRMYDAVTAKKSDSTSVTAYGYREYTIDLPYEDNLNTANDYATAILNRYKSPFSDVKSVSFWANRTDTLAGYGVLRDIGERVTVTETVTGINADYHINAVEYDYAKKNLKVKWILEPASFLDSGTLILDSATKGVLDTNTLGF